MTSDEDVAARGPRTVTVVAGRTHCCRVPGRTARPWAPRCTCRASAPARGDARLAHLRVPGVMDQRTRWPSTLQGSIAPATSAPARDLTMGRRPTAPSRSPSSSPCRPWTVTRRSRERGRRNRCSLPVCRALDLEAVDWLEGRAIHRVVTITEPETGSSTAPAAWAGVRRTVAGRSAPTTQACGRLHRPSAGPTLPKPACAWPSRRRERPVEVEERVLGRVVGHERMPAASGSPSGCRHDRHPVRASPRTPPPVIRTHARTLGRGRGPVPARRSGAALSPAATSASPRAARTVRRAYQPSGSRRGRPCRRRRDRPAHRLRGSRRHAPRTSTRGRSRAVTGHQASAVTWLSPPPHDGHGIATVVHERTRRARCPHRRCQGVRKDAPGKARGEGVSPRVGVPSTSACKRRDRAAATGVRDDEGR